MDKTMFFDIRDIENAMVSKTLIEVYRNLEMKGYNPTNQLLGYLITGDLSYITNYGNSRNKIIELGREKILSIVLKDYMRNNL